MLRGELKNDAKKSNLCESIPLSSTYHYYPEFPSQDPATSELVELPDLLEHLFYLFGRTHGLLLFCSPAGLSLFSSCIMVKKRFLRCRPNKVIPLYARVSMIPLLEKPLFQ